MSLATPTPKAAPSEAHFYRQLQQVTTRLHETENLDQLLLESSADICEFFNADRLTIYAVSDDGKAIISKLKTGLDSTRDLKLPISEHSIAGHVAMHQQPINVADVYDDAALQRIHPTLRFLKDVDQRSGYRTKQMMVMPIADEKQLLGVLQVINNKNDRPFGPLEVDAATQLCKTLATAIRQRLDKGKTAHRHSKYEGLVVQGLLATQELQNSMQKARTAGISVETILMTEYELTAAHIGAALARFFSVSYEPYSATRMRMETLHGSVKREFCQEQGWVVLEESAQGLIVMCLDPEAVRGSRMVPQIFPRLHKFDYRVTTQDEFLTTLSQLYPEGAFSGGSIDKLLADLNAPLEDDSAADLSESAAADNELVKFVNKVILDAYQQRASDIHIEPMPGKAKTGIRFRIDGSLQPYIEVPAHYRQAMVTRLKIMCDLDISEKRKPQDGKIIFRKFGPLDIELRVATIPSAGGVEDVVLRVLSTGEPIALASLCLTSHNQTRLMQAITQPHGLFYVCGPTGSGKTTTLHSILKHLNTADTKIWTAEDPVEITQKGLRQVQINKKAGIDFAMVMRSFLRADPDVIMVGESRDKETVSMGIEASLTGHRVFSTLHTNSAPESVTRLLDMGMDPYNFADALLGVLAQRLAKKLCTCKQAYTPDEAEVQSLVDEYAQALQDTPAWQSDAAGEAEKLRADWLQRYGQNGQLQLYRHVGCEQCRQTGYKGRIGLHELMVSNEDMKKQIQKRASVNALFATALEGGMRTLKMDGIEKVLQGLTDMPQVRSVCLR